MKPHTVVSVIAIILLCLLGFQVNQVTTGNNRMILLGEVSIIGLLVGLAGGLVLKEAPLPLPPSNLSPAVTNATVDQLIDLLSQRAHSDTVLKVQQKMLGGTP